MQDRIGGVDLLESVWVALADDLPRTSCQGLVLRFRHWASPPFRRDVPGAWVLGALDHGCVASGAIVSCRTEMVMAGTYGRAGARASVSARNRLPNRAAVAASSAARQGLVVEGVADSCRPGAAAVEPQLAVDGRKVALDGTDA